MTSWLANLFVGGWSYDIAAAFVLLWVVVSVVAAISVFLDRWVSRLLYGTLAVWNDACVMLGASNAWTAHRMVIYDLRSRHRVAFVETAVGKAQELTEGENGHGFDDVVLAEAVGHWVADVFRRQDTPGRRRQLLDALTQVLAAEGQSE